jgi:hypothetical protein
MVTTGLVFVFGVFEITFARDVTSGGVITTRVDKVPYSAAAESKYEKDERWDS